MPRGDLDPRPIGTRRDLKELNDELYNKLIDYQEKYPIPKKDLKLEALYVYDAFFYKLKNDTFVLISRSPQGLNVANGDLIFGVYRDNNLLPTFIRDHWEFYSKKFLREIITDSASLKMFQPKPQIEYPESFPPLYTYKVEGTKLVLNKIDTIWDKWR